MKVRLGITHDQLILYTASKIVGPAGMELKRSMPGRPVIFTLFTARYHGGKSSVKHDLKRMETDMPWDLRTWRDEGCSVARCAPVDLDLIQVAKSMYRVELPGDDQLPWPVPQVCQRYVKTDELAREIELRRAFAGASQRASALGVSASTPASMRSQAQSSNTNATARK